MATSQVTAHLVTPTSLQPLNMSSSGILADGKLIAYDRLCCPSTNTVEKNLPVFTNSEDSASESGEMPLLDLLDSLDLTVLAGLSSENKHSMAVQLVHCLLVVSPSADAMMSRYFSGKNPTKTNKTLLIV
ncbi:hypothetical protein VKT23_013874 [Stygiomarasmius scandens]|uniref:Uncharacterized protein n=1 Tax=Marasmiellus scandens TaxID=2682957 RepID=A0ABR1J4W1_9AGAR